MRHERALISTPPTESDHLFLTASPSHRGTHFESRDWSRAWRNFLIQESGSCREVNIRDLSSEDLAAVRFVYAPCGLRGRLSPQVKRELQQFVERGGVLVVEGLGVSDLGFGLTLGAEESRGRITGETSGEFCDMPFRTRGWPIEQKNLSGVLLEMDDHAAVTAQEFGQGRLVSFAFDFGLLLTGLQQGVPAGGKERLEKTFGTQKRVIEPEDIVQSRVLLDNAKPWADLFEKKIWQMITQNHPAPRWWYFPYDYSGAVFSTHDEEALGNDPRIDAMNAEEKELGVRSAFFMIADRDMERRWPVKQHALADWQRGNGPEVGLHWNRFKRPLFKIRTRPFFLHEAPLSEQTRALARRTGEPVRFNRNHYLALGTRYGEHFEKLAKAGIAYDLTYGPNQGGRGYLFGTGYPFEGLNWQGGGTGVLELPFQTQELWGQADLAFVEQLLDESVRQYHQCITLLFHPHYAVLQEEGRRVWLSSLQRAKSQGHWLPSLSEFFRFFERRQVAALQSRWSRPKLSLSGIAALSGMAVALPQETAFGRLQTVECGGASVEKREVLNHGFPEVLIRVPEGPWSVEAVYG